jgi:Na+/H+-dicarboxylate symporter
MSSKVDQKEVSVEEEEIPAAGCGILGRYPVLSVLLFAGTGIGVGIGLSNWEPDDPETKDKAIKWFGLIGDMFIRLLKAFVLPLVFINVVLSVVDMMGLGRASSIGWKTMGLYLLTTLIAAIVGLISILSFKGLFEEGTFADASPSAVSLGCNAEGFFMTEMDDGSLMCSDTGASGDISFLFNDLTNSLAKKGSRLQDISLSDTIYDGVFTKMITSNIFASFVSANFASVVIFAICFGVALGRVLHKRTGNAVAAGAVVDLFKELDLVFLMMINWVIMATPFAVFSLIVRAIGNQNDLATAFENVGYLVVATIVAMMFHFLVVDVGLLFFITKKNPFEYLAQVLPAQTMAFACASSAATIPMTLRCVKSAGISESVARFVIPLGATINMDGGAIYFPCACIWLAVLNGAEINAASYFLLIIIATVGSAGTAPVPSASLVLIITAYNTVFNAEGTPDGFEYILAIDWFMDRLRTTLNVTGDCVAAGCVMALAGEEVAMLEEDQEQAMESKNDVIEE